MKSFIAATLFAITISLLAGCPPVPTPPPPPPVVDDSGVVPPPDCDYASKCPPCNCTQDAAVKDVVTEDAKPAASDAAPEAAPPASACGVSCSTCACACACLAELGCPEGTNANCVSTCNHIVSTKITPYNPTCISAAKTVTAVQKCPAITCKK